MCSVDLSRMYGRRGVCNSWHENTLPLSHLFPQRKRCTSLTTSGCCCHPMPSASPIVFFNASSALPIGAHVSRDSGARSRATSAWLSGGPFSSSHHTPHPRSMNVKGWFTSPAWPLYSTWRDCCAGFARACPSRMQSSAGRGRLCPCHCCWGSLDRVRRDQRALVYVERVANGFLTGILLHEQAISPRHEGPSRDQAERGERFTGGHSP